MPWDYLGAGGGDAPNQSFSLALFFFFCSGGRGGLLLFYPGHNSKYKSDSWRSQLKNFKSPFTSS